MSNGLSTANFLGGAMQGYQFMAGVDEDKQRKEERKQMAGLRDADEARRVEAHTQDKQFHSARMRQLDQAEQERIEQQFARQLYAIDSGSGVSEEEKQQFIKATGGSRLLNPDYLTSPELGEALDIFPQVMSGEIDSKDPRAIKAANALINVQRGSKDGRQVSINRIVPSADGQGVHFGLHVRNADGTENPSAVLTDGRTSDPNDAVSTISLDEITGLYGATKNMRDLAINPKFRQMLYRKHGFGGQDASPVDQSQIKYNESRANYYNSKAENEKAGGGGAGGGKLPADAQMIEYYRGMGYGDEDAIAMTNNAVSSPEKFATTYSKMLLDSSKDMDGNPTITPEQAISKSLEIYNANFRPRPAKGEAKQPEKQSDNIVSDLMRGNGAPQVKPPMRAQLQAPAAAIEFLKNNPDQADNFKAKYGYLPK